MNIIEYIYQLEKVRDNHGPDLEVQTFHFDGSRQEARTPVLAYTMKLKGRENRPRFWDPYEEEDRKGDPVCRV